MPEPSARRHQSCRRASSCSEVSVERDHSAVSSARIATAIAIVRLCAARLARRSRSGFGSASGSASQRLSRAALGSSTPRTRSRSDSSSAPQAALSERA